MLFVFNSIPDWHKTQEMCDRIVSEDSFLIVYCPYKYIKQKCVMKLFLILKWHLSLFLIGLLHAEWLKKVFTALYADANLLYVNEDFANAVFNWNGMGILNIDINDINHDDNFHEVDLDTIILIRLLAWHINFEKHKVLKFE